VVQRGEKLRPIDGGERPSDIGVGEAKRWRGEETVVRRDQAMAAWAELRRRSQACLRVQAVRMG